MEFAFFGALTPVGALFYLQGGETMGKHPKFDSIVPLLRSNESFSLTEKEYEKKTGCAMPKSNYYLKNGSAFSKLAAEYGFEVTVQERTVSITKKSTP